MSVEIIVGVAPWIWRKPYTTLTLPATSNRSPTATPSPRHQIAEYGPVPFWITKDGLLARAFDASYTAVTTPPVIT